MIPSKPHMVSGISGDEEAEMERLTSSDPEAEEQTETSFEHLDEFIRGLKHDELEYIMSAARDALVAEGESGVETDTPPEPEESGATKNEQ